MQMQVIQAILFAAKDGVVLSTGFFKRAHFETRAGIIRLVSPTAIYSSQLQQIRKSQMFLN